MENNTTNDNNFQVDPDTGEVLHVCPCCGQSLPADFPHEVLTTVDPLDVLNYTNKVFHDVVIFDNYLLDTLRLQMRPASFKVVCFLVRHTKGHHNDPRPRSFTYEEIKAGTGITSDGTLWASLAELEEGNEALGIAGLDIIRHDSRQGDEAGNRYYLNTERERPGEPLLFYANSGNYTPMHESLIDDIMPLLQPLEWSLFVFLFRKTIGWHKQEDCIALSQFRDDSGIRSTPAINDNLDRLQSFRIDDSDQPLIFEVKRTRKGRVIRLNPDFYLSLTSRGNLTGLSRQSNGTLAAIERDSRGNLTGLSRQSNTQNRVFKHDSKQQEKQHETTTETPQPNQPCKPVDVQLPEQQKGQNNQDEKTEILIQLGITWANVQQQIINRAENDLKRLRVGLDHKALHPGTGAGLYVKWLKGELDLKWRHEDADGPPPEPAPVNGSNGHGQGPGLSPGFYQAIGLCPEWEAAKAILKSRMGGATFSLLQDADAEILGDTMVIKSYRADFIQNRLGELIAQAVATACGRQISLEFQVLGVECHE